MVSNCRPMVRGESGTEDGGQGETETGRETFLPQSRLQQRTPSLGFSSSVPRCERGVSPDFPRLLLSWSLRPCFLKAIGSLAPGPGRAWRVVWFVGPRACAFVIRARLPPEWG